MKPNSLALVGCLLFLCACSKPEPPPATESKAPAGPVSTQMPAAQPQAPKVTTAERIQEIEASGQTGLWSSVTEVCTKEINQGLRTTLTWNVKDKNPEKVVVFVIDKHGERHFGQGGPVGEKETGPWLRPGLSFKIRDSSTNDELGSVVIGEKSC